MNLTAEQIQANWVDLMEYIEEYIPSPRKEKLLEFYDQYSERLMLMPAAHKKEYHNVSHWRICGTCFTRYSMCT